MKRQTLLVCVLVLLSLAGCTRPDQPANNQTAGQSSTPVNGDWIVGQYSAEPDGLNPTTSTNTFATYVEYGVNYSFVYETLMQYDPQDGWRLKKPLLAEAYPEVSDDHLTYTFKLRDGVKWHDGKPLTIDDLVFSAKALMCPGVDNLQIRSQYTDLINAEAVEGNKIRFTVAKPYFLNDSQLGTMGIIPKHIFDPEGLLDGISLKDLITSHRNDPKVKKFAEAFMKHPNNRLPVGTGPYKFDHWDTNKEIAVVRNPDYWGQKPYLDKVVIRIIQDATAALTALKGGDIDFLPRLSSLQYSQQTSGAQFDQQFTKTKYAYPSYYYLSWNEERPFFKDKRVRQAMTMLVPRQQIIDTVRFGLGRVAASHFTPDASDFNPNVKPLPYDPVKAAALLDEAGWKDSNGDGIRDKDGIPFRFEFLGSSQNQFTDQLMPILKEEFRKVGIDMIERRLEFVVQVDAFKDHKFDAGMGAWVSDLQSDPYQLWFSANNKQRGSNYVSYNNPEVDKILLDARQEFDPAKRKQMYWRFQEILHDEQPYTFLLYPQESAAYSKRFQNVTWMPARPSYDLTQWFVPKGLQRYTASSTQ